MIWAEITVFTSGEAVEALSAFLGDNGFRGASVRDASLLRTVRGLPAWEEHDSSLEKLIEEDTAGNGAVVVTYHPTDDTLGKKLENLKGFIDSLREYGLDPGIGRISVKRINEEDWAEAWKSYFQPERIGDRVVIKPTWKEYSPKKGDIVVELDPGRAFGTGSHPTTASCIRILERYVKGGERVLDIGTGSGILSIVAAKLGAGSVLAVDIDPVAVETAGKNVRLNLMEDSVTVTRGNLLEGVRGEYDLIVANIIAAVIVDLTPRIGEFLAEDGRFIASGVVDIREDEVADALVTRGGLSIIERVYDMEWVSFVCKKAG